MSAYLLSWNPARSSFTDEHYRAEFPRVDGGNWDIGKLQKVVPRDGDEFFLVRVGHRHGVKPTGIVGYGIIASDPYPGQHWDQQRAARGEKASYVDINFERQIHCLEHPEAVLGVDILHRAGLTHKVWAPKSPMMQITDPDDVLRLKELFEQCQEQGQRQDQALEAEGFERKFIEGEPKLVREHLARERCRALVELKKRIVLDTEGKLACEVCGFDFAACYGEIGIGFIEAHHLVPIVQLPGAEARSPADLALVCSNCQRMLHRAKLTPPALRQNLRIENRSKPLAVRIGSDRS